jgi:hypothetical protein
LGVADATHNFVDEINISRRMLKMNQNVVIAIVLGALVLIAAVEAYQLMGIKNKIESGNVQVGAAGTPVQSGGGAGAPALPSSLQNLPGMVGGC